MLLQALRQSHRLQPHGLLELTAVFVAAGTLFILLSALFWFGNAMAGVLHDVQGPIRTKLARLTPIITFVVAYVLLFGRRWRDWIWLVGVLLVLAALDFLFPMLRYRGTFIERLAASEVRHSWAPSFVLLEAVARRFGPIWVKGMFWLIIALAVVYAAGRSSALNQEDFLVASTSPERVVLRIYGDMIITASFDKARSVERKFVILKTGEPSLVLRTERVGPLEVVKSP